MKLSMRYHPLENGGEPRVFSIPKRQSTYRVDLYVKRADREHADKRVIRFTDRFRADDVYTTALAEFKTVADGPETVEDAYFEVWCE